MKFSTFHLFPQPADSTTKQVYQHEIEVIRWADEIGFDTCWIAEHHFRDYGVVPHTLLMLGHLAGITRRIRLGNAVVIMPFHHPLRVAEEGAMVDVLSDGRFTFGFGRGYQSVEFAGFDIPMADTRERTDEAVEIVLKAWSGEPFSHRGKFYSVENVRVMPTPVQKPHPPVRVASIGPESIEHYAKKGIPFMVDGTVPFTRLKHGIATWKRIASAHGHSVEDAEIVCMRSIHIAETTEKARDFVRSLRPSLPFALAYNPYEESSSPAQEYARESAPIDPKTGKIAKGYEYWEKGYAGKPASAWEVNTDDAWNERWVAGDLERVHNQIEELESIGVRNIVCSFSARGVAASDALPETRKRMERFAREVIEPFQRKSTVGKGRG